MNNQFIEKSMSRTTYVAHTSSCYHNIELDYCYTIPEGSERNKAVRDAILKLNQEGRYNLLPYRLTFLKGETMVFAKTTGRALLPMAAQLKGTFTKVEDSPYKTYKPYQVQTGLWKVDGYQSYFAGSIGITGSGGKIDRDNSDLAVIHTTDWKTIEVFIFRGLAGTNKQLDYLPDVMEYLKQL